MSTKSADHKNKESEATPVGEEQKGSKGRKSLKSRSPAAMREKAKVKSPPEEKVEENIKTDEPKQRLGVEKKSRQKSRSPAGPQRSVSPKKAVKKTESKEEEIAAIEGKSSNKSQIEHNSHIASILSLATGTLCKSQHCIKGQNCGIGDQNRDIILQV